MEELYSIKNKKTGRYIKYCDDNWYETSGIELRLFTKDEAEKIAKKLRHHYVYNTIISNGTETYETNALAVKPATEATPVKKFGTFTMKFKK